MSVLAGHWHLISGQARCVYGGGGWLPFPAVRRRDHRLDGAVNDGCGSGVNMPLLDRKGIEEGFRRLR